MKGFLLFPGADLLIVVFDAPIRSGLTRIVFFLRSVKQLVVYIPDVFVAVFYIQVGALGIHIGRLEFPAVVIHGPFTHHSADGSLHLYLLLSSLHNILIFPSFRRAAAGSVTLVKSNAKALLTLRIKSALRPTGSTDVFSLPR